MDTDLLITTLGTWTLIAAAVSGWLFLVLYSLFARWWESATGCYIWTSSLAFSVILTYNYAALSGWITHTRPWIRLLIYGGILVVMVWRGVLMLTAQIGAYLQAKRNARI